MKPRVSLCQFKLPLVLAAGLVLYHGWSVAAVAQSALPATVPASVSAIALTVTPNPAKVKEKNNLDCYGHNQQESSDRRYRHFFSMASCRWVARRW